MNRHLQEEEVLAWAAGEREPSSVEHMAACAQCRGEVGRLGDVLGGFRTTARAWAEEVRLEVALGPVAAKPWSFRGLRLAAAMALVLLCFGLLMTRTQFTGKVGNQQANELSTGAADDAVLERVDAALSRSAPSAMEPLSQLVPTDHKVKTGDVN